MYYSKGSSDQNRVINLNI